MNTNFKAINKHFTALDKMVLGDKYSLMVSEGSSRSGKTYSAIQYFMLLLFESKTAIKVAVCRQEATTIRRTIWKDIMDIVDDHELRNVLTINKSEMIVTFPNGSEMFCLALCNAGKVHGTKCHYYIIDEAIEVLQAAFLQLNQRTSLGGVLCYNPSVNSHWIFDSVISRDDCIYLHSTYLDNEFLEQRIVDEIECYNPDIPKNVENGTADKFMWSVYGLGLRGQKEGAIYTHIEGSVFFPISDKESTRNYAIDFGFATDPTAVVEHLYFEGREYVRTLLYETGLVIASEDPKERTLLTALAELDIPKDATIVCDYASPAYIESLRRAGYNAYGCLAKDKVGSINIVKSRQITVPFGDPLWTEIESYTWKTRPDGTTISPPKPIDKYDHGLDALAYLMTYLYRNAVQNKGGKMTRGNQAIHRRDLKSRFGRDVKCRT